MLQPFDFIPVMYRIAETGLRLWISANVVREYELGQFEIMIEHDPELRHDQLLRPTSPEFRRSWNRVNPATRPPPEFEPNRSALTSKLVSFGVDHRLDEGQVRLLMRHQYKDFPRDAAKLEQALPLPPGSGFELIHQALKASAQLTEWDYRSQTEVHDLRGRLLSGPPRRQVVLYLERALAGELAAGSSFEVAEAAPGDVLLARRDIALS